MRSFSGLKRIIEVQHFGERIVSTSYFFPTSSAFNSLVNSREQCWTLLMKQSITHDLCPKRGGDIQYTCIGIYYGILKVDRSCFPPGRPQYILVNGAGSIE